MASRIAALASETIVMAVNSSIPWITKSSVRAADTYVRIE